MKSYHGFKFNADDAYDLDQFYQVGYEEAGIDMAIC